MARWYRLDLAPVGAKMLLAICVAALSACAAPLVNVTRTASEPEALALLDASRQAHGGAAAFAAIRNLNVSYEGEWRTLVKQLQPVLVDAQFRSRSQERMLLHEQIIAQLHTGDGGTKYVRRAPGQMTVAYNGKVDTDFEQRASSALVSDGYRLFLMGPFFLDQRSFVIERAGEDTVRDRPAEVLAVVIRPGLGFAPSEKIQLYIDRETKLVTRVRFSLDGLASTQGAAAEVDLWAHRKIGGIVWPTEFFERLRQPIPMLPVHAWRLTGIDINRNYSAIDLSDTGFTGAATTAAGQP